MLNNKVINFSILILSFHFVAKVECKEFDIKKARKLVIEVFDYIKPMFGSGDLKLDGYKTSVNGAKSPEALATVADNKLTENQISALQEMGKSNRDELTEKLNTFTENYQKLLNESNNDGKTVPFQTLKSKVASGRAAAENETQEYEDS